MLQITFRHMTTSEALRSVAQEKFDRLQAHYAGPVRCHLVIDCGAGHARKGAQFTVHADLNSGREDTRIDASTTHAQAATAVREVFARLDRQLATRQARRAEAPLADEALSDLVPELEAAAE